MKKVLSILLLTALTSTVLVSCVKNWLPNETDFSGTQPFLEMRTANDLAGGYNNIAGLANFGKASLSFSSSEPDTLIFYVNLASASAMNRDLNVTIGSVQSALDNYNADTTNGIQFKMLPDSAYSIPNQKLVIPAGQHVAQGMIIFYPSVVANLDPTTSYLLPVGVVDGDGVSVSANQGAIYYHVIGNPVAGTYEQEWIRWSQPDSTQTPDYDLDLGPAAFSAVSPTSIQVQSGTGVIYVLSFSDNGGTLSNFNISFDPASVSAAGITITGGPKIEIADPVNGVYRFWFTYNNSAGDPRVIVDQFVK